MKRIVLSLALANFVTVLFSQQVNEGKYNSWGLGPAAVYGNLVLKNVTYRWYYKIEKQPNHTVRVQHYNPSGIITGTTIVAFKDGIVNSLADINQWGETVEVRRYKSKGNNEFIVTYESKGANNILPCKYSIHKYKDGLLTEIRYYSFTDKLMENNSGYAIVRYERYNDNIRFGEINKVSFFNEQGLPVISKATYYHSRVDEYDEKDNKIKETYLGVDGIPIITSNNNLAGIHMDYDADNNRIKFEYLGLDGKIKSNMAGVAYTKINFLKGYPVQNTRYDSLNRVTRASSFGDGVSIIKDEFDDAGNNTKEAYFNEDENPITNTDGIHEKVYSFSDSNMLVETAFFDDFEKPSVNRDNIHSIKYVKDDKGRIVQESSYDLHGNPVKNFTDEVYLLRFKYDEFGRIISRSYWKDSVTKMSRWDGSYEQREKYNEDGLVIENANFDADGNPFISSDGSSIIKMLYNNESRLYEREFLNNDVLVMRKHGITAGYAIINYAFDSNGRVSEITFSDNNRRPVNAMIGFSQSFVAYRLACIYKGPRIVEQRFYEIGNETPSKIIDCLKNDFIGPNGMSLGRKKNVF